MIKDNLSSLVERAFEEAVKANELGPIEDPKCPVPIVIEEPKNPEHGDLACGVSLKLAGLARMSPLKIAEALGRQIDFLLPSLPHDSLRRFDIVAPGFINFQLGTAWLNQAIAQVIHQGDDYGRAHLGDGKKVLVEYVSANPTGELHIGHGRNAVFGSCLSNLLSYAGYKVDQEFYINDYGEQINQLGRCCFALYLKQNGREADYPQEGYPEEYLSDFVQQVTDQSKDQYVDLPIDQGGPLIGGLVKDIILQNQKDLLERLGITFDTWFSETTLHKNGEVESVFREFEKHGHTFENEGAYWLRATELGDERDRVLRKQGGATTYLANDSAYHLGKYRRGYDLMINIWGADHHGQVPGLKGAMKALGQDADKLQVILTQIVNLSRDGQIVRMSKRKGTVVMLSEVVDEVGRDAVRYYLAESNPQNSINFDLEIAKKSSKENPAFYIQYAHARCCSILRRALEESLDTESQNINPPIFSAKDMTEMQKSWGDLAQSAQFDDLYDKQDNQIVFHQKALVKRLEAFPAEVIEAARLMLPGRIARYAYDLANDLQKFYEVSRVMTDDLSVSKARLGLIFATRQVLANALGIIGVSAPERM